MINGILFCIQEANFCNRCFIVDIDKNKSNKEDIKILEQYAKKNIKLETSEGTPCLITNLLVQNIIWNKNNGIPSNEIWSSALHTFTKYADYTHDYEDTLHPNELGRYLLNGTFDYVSDYLKYSNVTTVENISCKIINSFLILEKNICN